MTEKSLRTILEEAGARIRLYRNPDVSEARKRLDEILKAAKLVEIGNDAIVDIEIRRIHTIVTTEYTVRGCLQSDEREFPTSILDAEDPVLAAATWGFEEKLDRAREAREGAERMLAECMEEERKIQAEFDEYVRSKTPEGVAQAM